jgi:hypothetical protein
MSLGEFHDTRVNLTCAELDLTLTGWVDKKSDGALILDLDNHPEIDELTVFSVSLESSKIQLRFSTDYVGRLGDHYVFTVPAGLEIGRPSTEARKRGAVGRALIYTQDHDILVEVLDVSKSGFGIRTSEPVEAGEAYDCSILGSRGVIRVRAEVIHSQEDGEGTYRVGLKIRDLSRQDIYRWEELVAA